MKILHLSTWATGGAAVAATRLSSELNKHGITSKTLHMTNHLAAYIDAAIGKFTSTANPIFHSYNYFSENISEKITQFQPNILHLHWVGAGFIRPESLKNYNLPIVWTLHDLWPLCGAEHLPISNRFKQGYFKKNRAAGESGLDLDRFVWQRKLKAFKNLNLTYVAPSDYVYNLAKSAKLLGDHQLIHIPNGIDGEIYKPKSKPAVGKAIILFAANNPHLDLNKGYSDFQKAIQLLPQALQDTIQIKVISGAITSDNQMAKIYASAALTVVPSRIETLSFVTMESMACGTPVVAYNVGGIPDLIDHAINGYLAKPYDIEDLAQGIEKIITNPGLRNTYALQARKKVLRNFKLKHIAEQYLGVYQELI